MQFLIVSASFGKTNPNSAAQFLTSCDQQAQPQRGWSRRPRIPQARPDHRTGQIAGAIKVNVNERLGLELIKDVLFDELNYVDKDSLKKLDAGAKPG